MKTPSTSTLNAFVQQHLDFVALDSGARNRAEEGARLFEMAKATGRKTTIGSVREAVGRLYRSRLETQKKAESPRKNGRTLAKTEVMRLAHLGAKHDLERLLHEVEILRIFLKGVDE